MKSLQLKKRIQVTVLAAPIPPENPWYKLLQRVALRVAQQLNCEDDELGQDDCAEK